MTSRLKRLGINIVLFSLLCQVFLIPSIYIFEVEPVLSVEYAVLCILCIGTTHMIWSLFDSG